ncbi:MAG: PKD domain-containing protein [Thermoplasmatota archaeon]
MKGCRTGDMLNSRYGKERIAILSALLIMIAAFPLIMNGSAGTLNNFTTGVDTGLPSSGDYSYIIGRDVNGDNDVDIAFGGEDYGSASSQGLYVYKGNGAGTWTSISTGLPTKDTWAGIQLADADADGKVEIYAGNEGWGTHSGSIKGVGAWEFSSNKWLSSGITQPYNGTSAYVNDIKVKNFTKTSGVDIAIATSTSSGSGFTGIKVFYGSGSSPVTWTANSNGLPTTGEFAGIDVGDINKDGLPDIASVAYRPTSVGLKIYTQNSNGNGWTDRSSSLPSSVAQTSLGVVIGDVNKDSHADIIVGTHGSGLRLLLGNSGGTSGTSFTWTDKTTAFPSSYRTSGGFPQLNMADIDKDGDLDLLAPKTGSGLHLFLGNGSDKPGTNFGWTEVTGKNLPTTMTFYGGNFFDLDGDGDLDLGGATWGNGIKIYETNLQTSTVPNDPPVPDAGSGSRVHVGETVNLDGTGSSDTEDAPSGDAAGTILSYYWNLTVRPPSSMLTDGSLTPSDSHAKPSFVPDAEGTFRFSLAVMDTDGKWSEKADEDTVTITVENFHPVPDAGEDMTIYLGESIELDGTGSTDPEDAPAGDNAGDVLSYDWNVTTYPPGSLIRDSSLKPTDNEAGPLFTPDKVGRYVITLAVNDTYGKWSNLSDEDSVQITVLKPNDPPVADGGIDQSVHVGDIVTLDGSRSVDVDGSITHYNWTCTSHPVGLNNPDSMNPKFSPTESGRYVFGLKVQDDNGSWSRNKDIVNITAVEIGQNLPPIADAGGDREILLGSVVTLDGSGSYDPDGQIITWEWRCTSHPSVALSDSNSSSPSFTPMEAGEYDFTLRVMDSSGSWSPTDFVTITVEEQHVNIAPTANAGPDQVVYVSDLITLDGSESYDIDGTVSAYNWTCTSHTVTLFNGDTAKPSFTPASEGVYLFTLAVSDDEGAWSGEDGVRITARNREGDGLVYPRIGPFLNSTGNPLSGVMVRITTVETRAPGISFEEYTDSAGYAEFTVGVYPGSYTCEVWQDTAVIIPSFDLVVEDDGDFTVPDGELPRYMDGPDDDTPDDDTPDDDTPDDDTPDDDTPDDDTPDDDTPDDDTPDDDTPGGDDQGDGNTLAAVLVAVLVLLFVLVIPGIGLGIFLYMKRRPEDDDENGSGERRSGVTAGTLKSEKPGKSKCPDCGTDMEYQNDFNRYKCPDCGKFS